MKRFDEIQALVEAIVNDFPDEPAFARLMHQEQWRDLDVGRELVYSFNAAEGLEMFDNYRMHALGNSYVAISRDDLVSWIVSTARSIGADSAMAGLEHYMTHESFTAFHVMLLHGPNLDFIAEFEDGIKLMPIHKVPVLRIARLGQVEEISTYPVPRVWAALIQQFEHPRLVKENNAKSDGSNLEDYANLELARLSLTVATAGGTGSQTIAMTTLPTDNSPLAGMAGWRLPSSVPSHFGPPLREIEAEFAKVFYGKMRLLDEDERKAIRIPLGKLNESVSTFDRNRKVIDLRTAIEALFLDSQDKSELSFRAAIVAALHVGSDKAERNKIFGSIRHAYDEGSRVLHTGSVSRRFDNGLIDVASSTVRKGILKWVDGDRPNWQTIELP